jgi:Transposase DDE domain group 1
VNTTIRDRLAARKRQIERRLDKTELGDCAKPMLNASNIQYEIADRARGLAFGGIGAMHLLARKIGLIDAINQRLRIFKVRLPYFESDHVLNIAYNALCNGTCLQDIELRRNDAVFLDALGTRRIPDPTTAGDFCRRFDAFKINLLQDIFDDVRIGVWQQQPPAFFEQAIVDVDGKVVETTGNCKEGMDISYNGLWGYHPLIVSLANTGEVMRLVNRSGNRPSHEGAAEALDRVIATCFRGGFRQVLLRGDTDFSQTQHLDRWNQDGRILFIFGYDSMPNLKQLAEDLPERVWKKLERPERPKPQTGPRRRPDNVKDRIVRQREFETLRLCHEEIADWDYQPLACAQPYRLIIVRKNISREKGEQRLFDEIRYFFYLTNDYLSTPERIVCGTKYGANHRCNQENLLSQLYSGCHALHAPVDNLESNWAYMVMTALAWNLKAWAALTLPETPGRWQGKYQAEKLWLLGLEFKTFVNAMIAIPCQLVRQARGLIFRVLAYNPHQATFFRLVDALHG